MTDKKIQNTIIIGIPAIFVILFALLMFQQKRISDLKKILMPSTGAGQTGSLDASAQNQNIIPMAVAEQKKTELINNTREIEGTVASVSAKGLKVSAEIVDLDKIKVATSEDASTFAKTKKEFTVATNEQTKFLANKLSDIKKGDSVKIHTDDPVYTQGQLTATIVISPFVSAEEAKNAGPKFVSGKVAKIENGILTVQTLDEKGKPTGKTYAVKAGSNTKIFRQEAPTAQNQTPNKTPIKIGDIKADNSVVALAAEAIKDRTNFEATEIILLVAAPK